MRCRTSQHALQYEISQGAKKKNEVSEPLIRGQGNSHEAGTPRDHDVLDIGKGIELGGTNE